MSSQFARAVFGCLTRTQDRGEKSERVVANLNRGGMAIGDSLLLECFQKLQIFSKIKPGLTVCFQLYTANDIFYTANFTCLQVIVIVVGSVSGAGAHIR